jgi:2-haloacid dehalogenase
MTLEGVEALCFDVFGTVVDWRSSVTRQAEALLAPHGVSLDWDAFARAWRVRYQPAMEAVRSGRRPFVKLDQLHRENLEAVLAEFGIEGLLEPALAELNLAWHRLDPWPDVGPGLARLKRHHILAPLSNGNVRLLVDLARHAGLPWDVILGAEVAQAYKPAPEAYLRAAEFLDLPPAACMMVAAHNDDLAAARVLGFRTAFVPRPLEHGPGSRRDLEPTADWDLIVPDFGELAARLGC